MGNYLSYKSNSTLKTGSSTPPISAGCFAILKPHRKIFLHEDIELHGSLYVWNVDVYLIFSIFGSKFFPIIFLLLLTATRLRNSSGHNSSAINLSANKFNLKCLQVEQNA